MLCPILPARLRAAALVFLASLVAGVGCLAVQGLVSGEAWARNQRVLTAPEELRPVRWERTLRFAPGQTWFDDVDGGVQSGTLAEPYGLPIWNGGQRLEIRPAQSPGGGFVSCGAGFIRFEAAGGVKECTLAFDAELPVVWTKSVTTFAAGTRVNFGYDASVSRGTLAREASLPRSSGGSETFPPGTEISFDTAGHVANAVVPPTVKPSSLAGSYAGAITLNVGGLDLGYGTPTIGVPFAVTVAGGVLSGGADAAGPPGGYNLRWSGNVETDGNIANGRITGFVHRRDNGEWLRWTVSGPLEGRFVPGGGSGTLSLTTADGLTTISGRWQVGPFPPVPAVVPTGSGAAAGPASISRWTARPPSSSRLPLQTVDGVGFAPGNYVIFVADTDATGRGITHHISYGPYALRAGETWHAAMGTGLVFERDMTPSAAGSQRASIYAENSDSQRWQAICVLPAGSPVSLCLGGSQNVVDAPGSSGAPKPAPGGAPSASGGAGLAGEWDWFVNGLAIFNADGTGRQGGLTLKWTLIDAGSRTYRVVWSHGYTDTLVLSPDGSALEGRNQAGARVTARRRGAAPNPAGGLVRNILEFRVTEARRAHINLNGNPIYLSGRFLVNGQAVGTWDFRNPQDITRVFRTELQLAPGSTFSLGIELPATGYGPMTQTVTSGPEPAVWTLDWFIDSLAPIVKRPLGPEDDAANHAGGTGLPAGASSGKGGPALAPERR